MTVSSGRRNRSEGKAEEHTWCNLPRGQPAPAKTESLPGLFFRTLRLRQREFENLRLPYLFNLRTDPYERATITSNEYWNWYIRRVFLLVPAQEKVGEFLATFEEYPPRQEAATFTIDHVLETLKGAHGR